MAHRGGAGRQEPSILWIARVLRHELVTFPAQSPTLDNRIRLQIPLNLLERCHYLVRSAMGVNSLPCLPDKNGDDSGCEGVPKMNY